MDRRGSRDHEPPPSGAFTTADALEIPAIEVSDWQRLAAEPLVSVIMITYRHEAWIADAIAGVLAQRSPFPIELLLGEDHGLDQTLAICRQAQRDHPDVVRLVTADVNVGAKRNLLRLQARARGRYLAYCEGDDMWTDPGKLAAQVRLLDAEPRATACFTRTMRLECRRGMEPRRGRTIGPERDQREWSLAELAAGGHDIFHLCSLMCRNGAIAIPRWYLDTLIGDKPLLLLHAAAGKVLFLPAITSTYRIHGKGMASGATRLSGLFNRLAWQRRMAAHLGRVRGSRLVAELVGTMLELLAVLAMRRGRWLRGRWLLARVAALSLRSRPLPGRQLAQAFLACRAGPAFLALRSLHRWRSERARLRVRTGL